MRNTYRKLLSVLFFTVLGVLASEIAALTVAPAGPMASARTTHTSTLLNDGSVLIVGGVNQDGVVKTAELFDPRSMTFGQTGKPIWPRYLHTATLLTDGRVLLVGGIGRANIIVATAELYDPKTKSFSPAAKLKLPRHEHCATTLRDGRVLISGGYAVGQMAERAEIYDPITNSFTEVGNLIWPRAGHAALLLTDGNVLVAGGSGRNLHGNPQSFVDTPWTQAEVFDTVRLAFFATGVLDKARPHSAGVVLPDGRAALFGGGWLDSQHQSEFYDLATRKFTLSIEGPGYGPRLHTATLLPDGRVTLVGGVSIIYQEGQWALPSIAIFDSRTNQFSDAVIRLQDARQSHTATLLQDGRVLVVGGVNRAGALRSAEVISP